MDRKRHNQKTNLEHGKLQPQAIDLEEAVLGSMMLEKQAIVIAIDILKPESFYRESNQKIFNSMNELFKRNEAIDLLTVTNDLKKRGELEIVGGAYYISQLTNRIASATNIEHHCRIVQEKFIARETIRIGTELIVNSYDETNDVFDSLTEAVESLTNVFQGVGTNNSKTSRELTVESIKHIEKAQKQNVELTGVPSGFIELDKETGGFQPSDLIIIAARPAMGKTALAMQIARNATNMGFPTLVESMEMSGRQLQTRNIAGELQIDSKKITKNPKEIDLTELNQRITDDSVLMSDDLIIDESFGITIDEFISIVRRINRDRVLKGKEKLKLIIADYLQLMSGSKKYSSREQEISEISRKLKGLAKELNVPVIALSQLSRDVERRSDKRPRLADLRESGSIEQDADIVMFLVRPEYYGILEDEEGNTNYGIALVDIAKHRNGSTTDFKLYFNKQYTTFNNIKEQIESPELNEELDDDQPF